MVEMMAMMWIVNKDGDETYSQTVSDSQLTLRSGRLSNVWSLRFCRSKKTLQAFRNIKAFGITALCRGPAYFASSETELKKAHL